MSDRSAFMPFTYATEDGPLLLTMLEEGRYDVVVGNPPYITVKDKALNQIYRSKYANVCKGTYALTVPFMALFFALAKSGEQAGWVGQITSNSFMKREFGTKLIEDFLAHQDLRLVVDTSGAYIPGHGTPTVIIVGRNQTTSRLDGSRSAGRPRRAGTTGRPSQGSRLDIDRRARRRSRLGRRLDHGRRPRPEAASPLIPGALAAAVPSQLQELIERSGVEPPRNSMLPRSGSWPYIGSDDACLARHFATLASRGAPVHDHWFVGDRRPRLHLEWTVLLILCHTTTRCTAVDRLALGLSVDCGRSAPSWRRSDISGRHVPSAG